MQPRLCVTRQMSSPARSDGSSTSCSRLRTFEPMTCDVIYAVRSDSTEEISEIVEQAECEQAAEQACRIGRLVEKPPVLGDVEHMTVGLQRELRDGVGAGKGVFELGDGKARLEGIGRIVHRRQEFRCVGIVFRFDLIVYVAVIDRREILSSRRGSCRPSRPARAFEPAEHSLLREPGKGRTGRLDGSAVDEDEVPGRHDHLHEVGCDQASPAKCIV